MRNYRRTRQADERITEVLKRYLDQYHCQRIVDVGAGPGNYAQSLARLGKQVIAVEPDILALCQANANKGTWLIQATAEQLPLNDNSVEAAICVNALHQFQAPESAFRQMTRVVGNGPIIILTADRRQGESTWIRHYFPMVWRTAIGMYPPLDDLISLLRKSSGKQVHVKSFPVPRDMNDHFFGAGWHTPHLYLQTDFLQNISAFTWSEWQNVCEGMSRLSKDLRSGRWHNQYAQLDNVTEIDFGYRFLVAV